MSSSLSQGRKLEIKKNHDVTVLHKFFGILDFISPAINHYEIKK